MSGAMNLRGCFSNTSYALFHPPAYMCNVFSGNVSSLGSAAVRLSSHHVSIISRHVALQGCHIIFHNVRGKSFRPKSFQPMPLLSIITGCYSQSDSPCRLMKVRMPVMVARSSILGNSIRPSVPLDSSSIFSTPLFPRHDHSSSTRFVKDRQLLLSQDLLDSCLCAGRS